MNVSEIAALYWTDGHGTVEIAKLAKDWLRQQAPGETFTTSALVRAIGGKSEQITALASRLTNARNDGLLGGCFERDEKHKSFGRARVLWHAPAKVERAPIDYATAGTARAEAEAKAAQYLIDHPETEDDLGDLMEPVPE